MQIEVGEYKTRECVDVTVVAVVDGIVIGYLTENGPTSVNTWRADNGRHFIKYDVESSIDLVRKKPQRIKFEKWATLYREANGGYYIDLHNSLNDAKSVDSAGKVAITKIVIDCEEGENLD